MAKAGRGDDQYMVRFPEGLRETIKKAAEENARSMNSEIVGRLEAYDAIHARMQELVEERDKLAAQLQATRDAREELRAETFALQELLKIRNEAPADPDGVELLEKRFSELKEQSAYLEKLKAELLELSKERDEMRSEAEARMRDQAALIDRLSKSQETNAVILRGFRKVFLKAADGNDDELKKLVEVFQTIGEEDA